MDMLNACWSLDELVGQLRTLVDADIPNRVRPRLKVDSWHGSHPWSSSDLKDLFTGHLKTLLG